MAAGEMALLYHLEGERARRLKLIFVQNKIRIRQVERQEYLQPIGVLAGILDASEEIPLYDGEEFGEEMLVLKGIYGKRLDLLLAQMRKLKVKAIYSQIPEKLTINVDHLGLGKTIQVGALHFEGLEVINAKNAVVCAVQLTRAARGAQANAGK